MLRKLLKYEFKATGRIFLLFFVAMVALAGINRLFMEFDLFDQRLAILPNITVVLYVMIIFTTFALTFVVMIQRFYKNLLGDEGYLTFTLPVKPAAHIISKMLVSFVWLVASIAVTILSILILSANPKSFRVLGEFFRQVSVLFTGGYGQNSLLLTLELIFGGIVGIFTCTLMVYAAIAIGHLCHNHRVLASFGAYLGLMVVIQIVTALVMSLPIFNLITSEISTQDAGMSWMTGVLFPVYIVLDVLFGVAFFLITKYIFAKRLNLE